MPTPNPHTFPLVAYPGLAPELDIRSGMGGWEPYAQPAPSDRLLPFVLARRISFRNAVWISCAWIEHAETGVRVATLVPTGSQPLPAPVPSLGIVFNKLPDPANQAEYFTYDGALIPGLAALLADYCGVPLRLVVDNAYQSPRFLAIAPAANLPTSYMPLEWYHNGPLQGVPYGNGFRQRLYIDNGSLQELDHRVVQESTPDPNGGPTRIDSMSVFRQVAFNVSPAPAYLTQAVGAAIAVRTLTVDGQPWRLLSTKGSLVGTDGGRTSLVGTLEDQTPILRRGCDAPALAPAAFPVGYVPRGWRCGDASDTAPDFAATGAYSCQLEPNGTDNTGYVLEQLQDLNPNSPTYGQIQDVLSSSQDLQRCPLRVVYSSVEQIGFARRNNCGPSKTGASVAVFAVPAGYATSQISQQDADDQALDYARTQAQAEANLNTVCREGRSIYVALRGRLPNGVKFDLVRDDSNGDVVVTLVAQALIDAGSGGQTQQFARQYTLVAGATSALGLTMDFGPGILISLDSLVIQTTAPSDYLHL